MALDVLRGKKQMQARILAVAQAHPGRVKRALYREAQIEMTEMKRRVPVDTGALRASGYVEEPVVGLGTIYTMLVFGGVAGAYAIPVHEDLEAFHKVGQAKYAESVLRESAPYMGQRIARRLDLGQKA